MFTLLALLSAPALAVPSIAACGNVPGTIFDTLSCQSLCVIQANPTTGQTEVFCDSGRDHVAAGAAIDGNGGGYTVADGADAEYVIIGADNAWGTTSTNRFCCSVQDDAFEARIVRLMGTEGVDHYNFRAPQTILNGIDMKNPDPAQTMGVAGIIQGDLDNDVIQGAKDSSTLYSDWLFGEAGDDDIDGSFGEDLLDGGSGVDDLNGGGGADLLKGRANDDFMLGGDGQDILLGGEGDDDLDGGPSEDCMQPEPSSGSLTTSDVVFDDNEVDTLDMPSGQVIGSITLSGAGDLCTAAGMAQAPTPDCDTLVAVDVCQDDADTWEMDHAP